MSWCNRRRSQLELGDQTSLVSVVSEPSTAMLKRSRRSNGDCTSHDHCASTDYCDIFGDCYDCLLCVLLDDSIGDSCPARCNTCNDIARPSFTIREVQAKCSDFRSMNLCLNLEFSSDIARQCPVSCFACKQAVTDLYLSDGLSCPTNYFSVLRAAGLTGDLNQGDSSTTAKYIRLCARSTDGQPAITELHISGTNACPTGYDAVPHASSLNGDLNQGAGGLFVLSHELACFQQQHALPASCRSQQPRS